VNRIEQAFAASASRGQMVLSTYLVAGYPTFEGSLDAAVVLAESGSDMIEIGIPYSDPVADGKVLQKASGIALEGGMTPARALVLAKRVRRLTHVPILMMTYYNIVLQYGIEAFCSDCRAKGVDGLLVPDLPVEESEELLSSVKDNDLNLIYFLSVNSPVGRARKIARVANGFVYLFAHMGVTGERTGLSPEIRGCMDTLRPIIPTPICAGFGISEQGQVRLLKALGLDGLIVGSGIASRLPKGLETVRQFVSSLKEAC